MKYVFLLLLTGCTIFCKAQLTKDSLLSKMTKEACTEISKKDLSKINKSSIEQEMGLLLTPVFMNNMKDIQEVYGVTMTDPKGIEKIGMDLGMKLVTECPDFAKFSMELAKDESVMEKLKKNKVDKNGKIIYTPPVLADEVKGNEETYTLVAVNPGDITTLTVKSAKGKIEKLYWMEYFENADELKLNAKKYIGKKVVVATSNKDVYNVTKKDYKSIKIIESLDLAY